MQNHAMRSVLIFALLTAACGGSPPAGPPAGAAPPPTPVTIVTVAEAPVERVAELVGTIRSRRATTIQPQAEGFLTAIAVDSGQRVSPGEVLFEIDARSQQAAVGSLESLRAARAAEETFATQQLERARALLEVGAMSQQEFDQAEAAQMTAAAQLRSVEEQLREQQTELDFFQVRAPTAGMVGDVPVRVGDRVTRSTVLTTLADNTGLEVYLHVPVQQAPSLDTGLPVRLLDAAGQVAANTPVSFVSPTVDDTTQTVLVKAPVPSGDTRFRADQFVRATLVLADDPGVTVPVMAVSRINAQYFVFVAQESEGGLVAAQRPITVGPVVGDAYLVRSGLAPGDRLIVAGTQKIGDGSPVQALPQGAR